MTIGELSFTLSIIGVIPYIVGIFQGKVRPHRISWFLWTIILLLSTLGYKSAGAHDSLWFIVGDLVVTALVFFLSLWRGKGGFEKLNLICLAVALVGLGLWQLFEQPLIVLLGTLIADFMGAIPTIKKSLDEPETESATTYAWSTLAAVCGIMAVGEWNFALLFYPIYLFLANFVTSLVILVSQYQERRLLQQRLMPVKLIRD